MTVAGMRLNSSARVGPKEHWFLRAVCCYLIPCCIVLLSLTVMFFLPKQYPSAQSHSLSFHSGSGFMQSLSAEQSQRLLQEIPTTRLAHAGNNWLVFQLPALPVKSDNYLVHVNGTDIQALQCLRPPDGPPLPVTQLGQTPGPLLLTGYTLDLGSSPGPDTILCQIHASNTQLSIDLWPASGLLLYATNQTRGVSLLEGGLLSLCLLILILALVTRDRTYLLLSIWLLGNLRLGATVMGWDHFWLGHHLPPEYIDQVRRFTIACYFLISAALFGRLFSAALPHPYLYRVLSPIAYLGLLLIALAPFTPQAYYLPIQIVSTVVALLLMGVLLVRILIQVDGSTRIWHLVLLSMVLCVLLSAVYLLVFGRSIFIENFNGVITLLLSSLMASLVVAEQIRGSRWAPPYTLHYEPQVLNTLSPVGFFILDQQQRFLAMDNSVQAALSIDFDPNQPVYWEDHFGPLDWATIHASDNTGVTIEIPASRNTNTDTNPSLSARTRYYLLRALNTDELIYGSLQDITATQQTMAQLQQAADSDPVTQLLNQRGLEKALKEQLEQAALNNKSCVLAYLNLNHIKYLNPIAGQHTNEALLKAVGELITDQLNNNQIVARLNNDEFLILFPNSHSTQVHAKANDIIQSLNSAPLTVGNRSFNLKSSIGLVELSASMSSQEAISAAHRAAREAHKQMQDVVLYTQNSHELNEHAAELRLFQELEGGSSHGLFLEMQAIMSLRAPLDSLNFEILLRVRDSTGQLLPSGKIIAAAEQSNTIIIIDKWVFGSTLEWLAKHEQHLKNTRQININLSGVSLNNDDFNESFIELLSKHEPLLKRICVEITEGVALADMERTRQFMSRLQKMGVRIALDDFGAGYTSFQYLRELPADAIKIDGALICDMLKKETNVAIVRTIVKLANNLGMVTIAEWVEDTETLKALADLGVDYVQGFGIAKPCSPNDILSATTILDLIPDARTRAIVRELHNRT